MAAHAVVARGRVGPGGRKSRGRVAPGEVASPKGRGPVGLARRVPGVRVALASCRPWLRVGTASGRSCSHSRHLCSQSEHEKREWEHEWRRVGTGERRGERGAAFERRVDFYANSFRGYGSAVRRHLGELQSTEGELAAKIFSLQVTFLSVTCHVRDTRSPVCVCGWVWPCPWQNCL